MEKVCGTCKETKPIEKFARKRGSYSSKCKDCHNRYQKEYWKNTEAYEKHKARSRKNAPRKRAAKYGLTVEQVEELFERANHECEICGRPATCIDHSHVDGRVRGVLCSTCNSGLGKLGDSVEGLQLAIAYLARVSA